MERKYDNKTLILQIILIFAVTRAAIVAIYFLYVNITGDRAGFAGIFGRWDTEYYLRLATEGYKFPENGNGQAIWAFFPLYPLVCRAFLYLTAWKIPVFYVCVAVSNACITAAAVFAVKTVRLTGLLASEENNNGDSFFAGIFKPEMFVAWLLMFGPWTVYFAAAYTESMFVLCIAMSFYFMKKRNFLAAGIMAMFAGGVRNLGCVLIVPLFMEIIRAGMEEGSGMVVAFGRIFTKPVRLLSLILTPVGTFAYMLYLYFLTGDAWAFKNVQIAWRDEYHFPVVGVLWDYCTGKSEPRYTVMGWICVIALVIYVIMIIKGLRSEGVFGICTLLIPLTSHVMSTPRFIAGSFVIWVGISAFLGRIGKVPRSIIMTVLVVIEVGVTVAWVAGRAEVM